MFKADTVVTGATGLIGRWLVPELTRLERNVLVLIRNAEARESGYRQWVQDQGGDPERIQVQELDLFVDDLGVSELDISQIKDVYHLAARYEFGLAHSDARQTNVVGSLRVLKWSSAMPLLRRFVFVTGYLGAVHANEITSVPASQQQELIDKHYKLHGGYEASKVEENILLQREASLLGVPVTVINPSAVIGDSVTGETTQYLGPSDLVRDLYFGKLPALVGGDDLFLPMVAVDYVAQFIARVTEYSEAENCSYWLLDQETPKLHRLIADMALHLGVTAPTIKLPKALVATLPKMVTGVEPETLSFLVSLDYDTASADALSRKMQLTMPDHKRTLRLWINFLVSKQFGAALALPDGGFVRAAGIQTYVVGDLDEAEVVMLHGLPLDSESWLEVEKELSVPSVRVDLPGHGRNGRGMSNPEQWMDALLGRNDKKPIIVAHSLGCEYALRYAQANPEKVGGLVLVAPFFLQSKASWWLRQPMLLSAITRLLGTSRFISSAVGFESTGDLALNSTMTSFGRPGKGLQFATALAKGSADRLRNELALMLSALDAEQGGKVPVKIIVGEADPLVEPHTTDQLSVVRGTGHYPQLTHSADVAQIIMEYIKGEVAGVS
ncbi:hypothetical protein A9Q99_07880 [Gammaproteobacteria bacterium 45_16_T64]|nr:hypothetical protein A9Q99_07880 [Gammaproteobacteria bacterium 45_16_T64]